MANYFKLAFFINLIFDFTLFKFFLKNNCQIFYCSLLRNNQCFDTVMLAMIIGLKLECQQDSVFDFHPIFYL